MERTSRPVRQCVDALALKLAASSPRDACANQLAERFEGRLRAVCYLSAVRFARLLSTFAASFAVATLAAGFPSCSNSSDNGSGDAGDDRMAIDLDSTLPPIDANTCDPCVQRCPCTPGDTFYNPARCGSEVCGANGVWGGVSCTVGPGCPQEDAGDGALCEPCSQVCTCAQGARFYNPALCEWVVCGSSGMWGGVSCIADAGCPQEAGDDAASPTDATADGPSEASADAPSEASLEAGGD